MSRIIQADFNNVLQDGTLAVSMRRIGDVSVDESLLVRDPADEAMYDARVISVDQVARQVLLKVEWEPRVGFVRISTPVAGRWVAPERTSHGVPAVVRSLPAFAA
ncbi:hypothetical protein [Agrococcus sp. SCSIO52902]|uniref:hypothetical protein n=1 Tax=Agrococcus sp. SCSIO52902 TaxID=2933290 RepID=UPI001FF68320|nr:hypothetical protein [Agrococcus sp. SCSIO52902]UOW01258.1 hypothetical protein MU522_02185 [Agrococcus sp. SCSIO52902]